MIPTMRYEDKVRAEEKRSGMRAKRTDEGQRGVRVYRLWIWEVLVDNGGHSLDVNTSRVVRRWRIAILRVQPISDKTIELISNETVMQIVPLLYLLVSSCQPYR
jgi:hypothetical protein